jgi:hypothetical protein
VKLLQEMKDDVLLLLVERKVDMTSGASFVTKCSLKSLLSVLLTLRTRRRTNSTLSSILPFKLPPSQKESWTDVSPISRIPSTREPMQRKTSHAIYALDLPPSGPRTRQSHATCFGRSHVLMRPAHSFLSSACGKSYVIKAVFKNFVLSNRVP